jgi:hypothetical protein
LGDRQLSAILLTEILCCGHDAEPHRRSNFFRAVLNCSVASTFAAKRVIVVGADIQHRYISAA